MMNARTGLIVSLVLVIGGCASLLSVSIRVRPKLPVPGMWGLASENEPIVAIHRSGLDLHVRVTVTETMPVATYTISRFTVDGELPNDPKAQNLGTIAAHSSSSVEFVFRRAPKSKLVHHWKLDRTTTWQSGDSASSSMDGDVSEGLSPESPRI